MLFLFRLCKLSWGYEPLPEELKGWAAWFRQRCWNSKHTLQISSDSVSRKLFEGVSATATKTYQEDPRREARPAPGGFGRIPERRPFLERRRTGLAEECQAKAKATILKARSKLCMSMRASAKNIHFRSLRIYRMMLEVNQLCGAALLNLWLQVSLCRAWCRDICPGGSQA